MDITVYKRGKDGKKIADEVKTMAIQLRFKERSIDLTKSIYIGRSKSNAVCIENDRLVSRKHALIEYIKGVYFISDCGSTNGTYVNNQPVAASQKIELKAGDLIRIGKTELTLS